MVSLNDFKVGQKAYLEGKRRSGEEIEEVDVIKVGRKYVTIKYFGREIKFENERCKEEALTEVTIYGCGAFLYPNKEVYLAKKKREDLLRWGERELKSLVRKLTTEQLEWLKSDVEKYIQENNAISNEPKG